MELEGFLKASAAHHSHLCPRQVLGVRAAVLAARVLALEVPRRDKRLLVITETDGCFTDGLRAVTGVSIGHRTLRVEDYGKIAATFIDVKRDHAIRVAPRVNVRERTWDYTPEEKRRYYSQLRGYQVMPADELFSVHAVRLITPLEEIISRPGIRTNCDLCGEEIINQREIEQDGRSLCRSCAGQSYYISVEELDSINLKT